MELIKRRLPNDAEEIREYQRLQRLFNAPTDNVELIKALFYTKDDPQPLYLGSKKTKVVRFPFRLFT